MTDQLTAAGLEIDSLTTRLAALKTAIRAACGANLDLGTDQPDGQFVALFAETVQAVMEVLQEIYTAMDPDEATGDALTALALITGTQRRAATYGTVTLDLDLDAAVTVPAGSVAHVLGDPTNRWATDVEVTSVGAGTYPVAATCTQTGPVQALAHTITVIATPIVGWNTVDNPTDATEGISEESDVALRLRREQELAIGGSTNTDAITADLLELTGMLYARTYENVTGEVDGYGRPGHSIECVVYGTAATAAIAEQIYASKAAGIDTHGTTNTYHIDAYGISHPINFTVAVVIDLYVRIDVGVDPAVYVGDGAVKTAVADWGDEHLEVNDDVAPSKIAAVVYGLAGVKEVSLVYVEDVSPPTSAARFPISWDEIGDLDTGRITVNSITYVDL